MIDDGKDFDFCFLSPVSFWQHECTSACLAALPWAFLLQAEDDHEDNANGSLVYYIALKNAGVPVEMHLYAQGGHGFGLRRTELPIARWSHLVETWLRTIGMISK